MSADSEQEPTGRRRKTRSDKGRPRKAKLNMPAPPKAIAEIDQRLAAAIAERTHAVQQVAKISYWQQKISALDQEINTLIGYTRQLTTGAPFVPPVAPVDPIELLQKSTYSASTYGFANDIPPTVGSIPAGERVKGPRPNSPNAADDIRNEGGFS